MGNRQSSYDSFNKVYVMVKCRVCMKLIGPSSPVIKCSRGFLQDDMIIEDSNIIVHLECYSEAGDLAQQIELDIKNS